MLVKGIFTQLSGAMGGIVGSHNRFGMYVRARTIPVNPNTSYQQAIRSYMAVLSTRWQDTLTPAQRSLWEVYGDNVPVINRLGDTIYLTGLNHFCRSNVPRLIEAFAPVDDGPTDFVLPSFTAPTIAFLEATDQIQITFNNADDWANETGAVMQAYVSRPVAPTINYFKGPYRYAGSILGNDTVPPTSPATIALPFPAVAGQKLFARIQVFRKDGRLSPDFRGGAIAA